MNFQDFLTEHYLTEASFKIGTKDWDRMIDLIVADKDGKDVAAKIKDKNKAIARFIAGVKLSKDELTMHGDYYNCDFDDFGNQALRLGATNDEIQAEFDKVEIPPSVKEKFINLMSKDKQMSNRFLGKINKKILASGFDIKYDGRGAAPLTNDGKEAMSRNGRKWTIGYKAIISRDGKEYIFNFDAITDEGDGPTYYVVSNTSDKIFDDLYNYPEGVNRFMTQLVKALEYTTEE